MYNYDSPLISVRFRLTGCQYSKLLSTLSDNKDSIVIGCCGEAEQISDRGVDLVITLHDFIDSPIRNIKFSIPKSISWLKQKQKYYSLIPVEFQCSGKSRSRERPVILDKLIKKTSSKGIFIQIEDNGNLRGTFYYQEKHKILDSILVAGPDIKIWLGTKNNKVEDSEISLRFEQSFGSKTLHILSSLKIGVVGVSGTGSSVAEMLYRLGVKELVLVDDDRMEEKNLGRIYNSSLQDAQEQRLKVDVIGDAFSRNGLPTKIKKIVAITHNPDVVHQLAQCDIIFGCMDTHSGRNLLNKICTFYSIPYFDLGVRLEADGRGGVKTVCGAVHYLQPDGSSLVSRKAVNLEIASAEDMKRVYPEQYKELQKEKYIKGVQEEKPAVITINTLIASLALNDFLARLHPYRNNPNSEFDIIFINLCEPEILPVQGGLPDESLARFVGLGDIQPLLGMPALG
jgi:hypothetical protein